MKPPTENRSLIIASAILILLAGVSQTFLRTIYANNPPQDKVKVTTSNAGGVIEVRIDTRQGAIKGYLPDDITWGESVSGTVVTEPKGSTPQEVGANKAQLENYKLQLGDEALSVAEPQFTVRTPAFEELPAPRTNALRLVVLQPSVTTQSSGAPGLGSQPRSNFIIDGDAVEIPVHRPRSFGAPQRNMNDRIIFPELSQQGRTGQIHGEFDGNLGNTRATFGAEQGRPNMPLKLLAESPRKLFFVAPIEVTGTYAMLLAEGDKTFAGNSRNIAVNLSAPKTNLMRGEKTTVTIEVSGLAGIIREVPLQLDAKGVINMDGGNFQNLRIKPEEVKLDGRYTTSRTITGTQAGGFDVTATVIVGPFDICLQDDVDAGRGFRWNTFTGDYLLTDPPTANAASTSGGNLSGTGKPAMKGCIITLSHNAPDRRVFATLDVCSKTGNASVERADQKTKSTITDKSTANSTCPTAPPTR